MASTDPFWLWQLFGRLHPLVVHFPIAILCVAALMEILALRKQSNPFHPAIGILLWTGVISALFAVLFGWMLAGQEGAEGVNLEIHRWAGIATLSLSALTLYFFSVKNYSAYRPLLFVTVAGVAVAGHYGAMITHGEDYITGVLPSPERPSTSSGTGTGISFASFGETLTPKQEEDLNLEVRTILAHNCTNCHGEAKKKGGLRLDSKEAIFAGGENGPVLVPGEPEKSEMIRRISLPAGHKEVMPSKGKLLSREEIGILAMWIEKGAPWPEGKMKSIYRVAALEPRLPEIPTTEGNYTEPIDRFVNAYFKKNDVAWPQLADDRTYIRRVYLDVTGLYRPLKRLTPS